MYFKSSVRASNLYSAIVALPHNLTFRFRFYLVCTYTIIRNITLICCPYLVLVFLFLKKVQLFVFKIINLFFSQLFLLCMYFMTCSSSLILKDSFSLIYFSEDWFSNFRTLFFHQPIFFLKLSFYVLHFWNWPWTSTTLPCTSNSWVCIYSFSFVIFSFDFSFVILSFDSLALVSLLLMFLLLNLLNLSSFLLSFKFLFQFFYLFEHFY